MARGGIPTKMWWDWSTAGQKGPDGKPFVEKDDNGWVTYDTKKGDFVWDTNVVPEYIWYNGQHDFTTLGETINDSGPFIVNAPQGSPEDGRIWPMKLFRGTQAYDPVNKVLAVPHLFGKDENAYWKSYDWGKAIEAGMADAEVPYSGEYAFTKTDMYWPQTHMVAPAAEALECQACHTENGRLANIEGVYMPAASRMPFVNLLGVSMVGLAVVGVDIHGGARVISGRKHYKQEKES